MGSNTSANDTSSISSENERVVKIELSAFNDSLEADKLEPDSSASDVSLQDDSSKQEIMTAPQHKSTKRPITSGHIYNQVIKRE